MKYFDRRILIPIAAVSAWAQQPSPEAAAAEASLRARAQEFFDLQVAKKYREAEPMVAGDTKDLYYNGRKFNIKSYRISRVELLDNHTQANVTISAKATLVMPGSGPMDFDAPMTTSWKIEDGKWVWYVGPAGALQTPFGTLKPAAGGDSGAPVNAAQKAMDLASLRSLVKIDRDLVEMTPDDSLQTVTVSNDLPGGVDLAVQADRLPGLSAQLMKTHLDAGEKTTLYLRVGVGGKGEGIVRLAVSPVQVNLDIRVRIH
jgi:hypothetical protein